MKTLLRPFSFAAILLGSVAAHAQWSPTGVADSVKTTSEVWTPGGGIYWWSSNDYAFTRDSINQRLVIEATEVDSLYTSFGVGWGDEDGSGDGDDFITIDLTDNALMSVDITNTHQDSTIKISFGIQDSEGHTAGIYYRATVPTQWGDMYEATEIEILPGQKKHVEIDFDQALIALDWTCSSPGNCPETSSDFRQDLVTGLSMNINPGAGQVHTDLGPFTGTVYFENFTLGVVGEVPVVDPDPDPVIDSSMMTFRIQFPTNDLPTTVELEGDFTDWATNAIEMKSMPDGIWTANVKLAADSTYEFKYVADGNYESFNGPCLTGAFNNRWIQVPGEDFELDLVCFESCGGCESEQSSCSEENTSVRPCFGEQYLMDDFTTDMPYYNNENQAGAFWWAGETYAVSRDCEHERMLIICQESDPNYGSFGVGVGMNNVMDLTDNAEIGFTLTNTHETDTAILTLALQDIHETMVDVLYAPTVTYDDPYPLPTDTILPGQTKQIHFDFTGAGINTQDWDCSTPEACPVVDWETFAWDSVTGVVFQINGGADAEWTNHSTFTGILHMENFYLGEECDADIIGVEEVVTPQIQVFPNPAINQVTIAGEGTALYLVLVRDILGNIVHVDSFNGRLNMSIDNFESGTYLVEISSATHSELVKLVKR